MSSLPTLVFVPGSWHKPTCYSKLIAVLTTTYSLNCVAVTLPSTSGDASATFKDDIDAVRAAILTETEQGRDVVVIAHSYGGMVGNSCIKGLTAPLDSSTSALATKGGHGHVIGLILIASGFTFTGLAFMDPFFGRPPPAWRANWTTGFAELVTPPTELFYHDVEPEEARVAVAELTPHSLKSLYEGGEHAYAGWRDLREVLYLGTIQDKGLPVVMQRVTVGVARGMGTRVVHRELESSHSPFLSMVQGTAGVVAEAVESFAGRRVEGKGDMGKVIVPGVRLGVPVTWWRYGLPGLIGRMVGKGVLAFEWLRRLWR